MAAAALPAAALDGRPGERAAVCEAGSGVSVVVDFRELGGGTQTVCDADGAGKSAATLITENGYALTYVQSPAGLRLPGQRQAGDDPCVNTPPSTAYWGLYWSNGTSGSWTYASLGRASSLNDPGRRVGGLRLAGRLAGAAGGRPARRRLASPTPPSFGLSEPRGSPTAGTTPTTSPTKSPSKTPTKTASSTPTKSSGGTPTSGGGSQPGVAGRPRPTQSRAGGRPAAPTSAASSRGEREDRVGRADASRRRQRRPLATSETSEATDQTSPASSEAGDPAADGGSVPLPLVLAIMAVLGAAVAGIVVMRGGERREAPDLRAAPEPVSRLPRDLHPVAWWLWALGLAAGSSMTTNPLTLLLLMTVAALVVAARRSDHAWSGSFRLYVGLAIVIVIMRVVFRLVFGGVEGAGAARPAGDPAARLGRGHPVARPVTQQSLLAGLYDGLRLAAIVICVGAANSLANPKRLLKSVPPALYEIGTALVVAVTVFPQLADSVRRVRRRPGAARRHRRPGRSPAPLPGAGAGGRPGALARPGGRHGRSRLRPGAGAATAASAAAPVPCSSSGCSASASAPTPSST